MYIYIYIYVCTYEVFPIITIVSKAFISGYPLIFVRVSKKSQGNSLDVYFLVGFRVISGFQRFSNDGSQEAWSTVSQLFQKETLWGCRNPKGVLWICWLNWESFKFACDYALLLFTNKGKWPASYIYSHIYAYNITHTYMYIYIYICTYEVFRYACFKRKLYGGAVIRKCLPRSWSFTCFHNGLKGFGWVGGGGSNRKNAMHFQIAFHTHVIFSCSGTGTGTGTGTALQVTSTYPKVVVS